MKSTTGGLSVIVMVVIMNVFMVISDHPCSSSCGHVHNITSPFRLTTDPSNCGDLRYTLSCENNLTVLYLPVELDYVETKATHRYYGQEFKTYRYYVQAINYNNYTIRIVDPNIQKDDCYSIPNNTLFHEARYANQYGNTYYDNEINIGLTGYYEFKDAHQLSETIVFFNCERPVPKNSSYIDAAPCMLNENFSSAASSFQSRSGQNYPYYYVYGEYLNSRAVEKTCWIEQTTLIQKGWVDYYSNVTSYDIHSALVYGFEISWLRSFDKKGNADVCFFEDEDSKRVRCVYPRGIEKCGIFCLILAYLELYVFYLGGYKYIVGVLATRTTIGLSFVIALAIYKWRRRHLSMYDGIETFLQSHHNLAPIRYSYREIRKMTKGFTEKFGQGGFGSVYKGKLSSGGFVAIKMLGKSKANGQEFINEVVSIGRIHHVNVVRLVGFCFEGKKRALVYDFMSNGSLDKHIFSREGKDDSLSSEEIFKISLGVARGIEYLHQGCDVRILHFDIKPHNILLDENFVPKVSDFGLARLSPLDNSIVSLTAARGTIGYIAPELFYKNIGGVSFKADVYSFGMLLMEMANKRKNVDANAENTSEIYFPLWIYDQFSKGNEIEIEDATEEEARTVKKMMMVALWCIQLRPCDRPSMNKVIEMLEGEVESLQMPPKLYLYPQEQEHEKRQVEDTGETSTLSEEDSEESSLISNAC